MNTTDDESAYGGAQLGMKKVNLMEQD